MTRKTTIFVTLLIFIASWEAKAQFSARIEVKTPVNGLCSQKDVYALFPMLEGHEPAICPVPEALLIKKLNEEVKYLRDHPNHEDQGMVKVLINCKGAVVSVSMSDKTSSQELDRQIIEIFSQLGVWKAGKLLGKNVDSGRLFTFHVINGTISFNRQPN